jgi:hypothetical protein
MFVYFKKINIYIIISYHPFITFHTRSPITRQKYQERLAKFLDFIPLDQGDDVAASSDGGRGHNKDIEQRALIFAEREKRTQLGV